MDEAKKQLFWKNRLKARYIKWEILQTKSDRYLQVGDLRFIDERNNIFQWPWDELRCIDYSNWLTTADKGVWYTKEIGYECAEYLLDLNLEKKFCCEHYQKKPFFVTFDLGSNCLDISVYTKYQWYTAKDDTVAPNRTPTSWNMFASVDGNNWTLLNHVEGFIAPVANYTLAYTSERIA